MRDQQNTHVTQLAEALVGVLADIARPAVAPVEVGEQPLAHGLKESAQLIGIGLTTLKELVAAGRIQTLEIGRRRVIRHEELVRFLDSLASAE